MTVHDDAPDRVVAPKRVGALPRTDASAHSGLPARGVVPAHGGASARLVAVTAFALVAFASNSLLCRLALGASQADPAAFTGVRLLSGALVLWLLTPRRRHAANKSAGHHWVAASLLFAYAAAFSFAYVSLSAGTGALILFGAVQATMLLAALAGGERPLPSQWLGLALALGGLAYLVSPGLTAPPLLGAILMAVAGVSWGAYSVRGRGNSDPLADTTRNFMRSLPFAIALTFVTLASLHASWRGILLAIVSGALASGLGYVAWYAALRHLTGTQAATVQLLVPALAAGGGVFFLGETISLRLVLAALLILGGVALAVTVRREATV